MAAPSAWKPTAASFTPAGSCRRSPAPRRTLPAWPVSNCPFKTIPLQACVSEPVKPILDQIVVSGSLHVYISQSARGEMVMGGATDPYGLYSSRSTLDFKESLMGHMLELFPFMGELRILRQWAGMADMTPDFSPLWV